MRTFSLEVYASSIIILNFRFIQIIEIRENRPWFIIEIKKVVGKPSEMLLIKNVVYIKAPINFDFYTKSSSGRE